jgi:hypothetical protein
MVKGYPNGVRKMGRVDKQTSAKDDEELPEGKSGRQEGLRWVMGRTNKTNFKFFTQGCKNPY